MNKEMPSVKKANPTLYLNENDCPEIKKMKAGKEYDFIVHAKMVKDSRGINDEMTGKKSKKPITSGVFEILDVDYPGENGMDDMDLDHKKMLRLEERAKAY